MRLTENKFNQPLVPMPDLQFIQLLQSRFQFLHGFRVLGTPLHQSHDLFRFARTGRPDHPPQHTRNEVI